MEKDPSLPLRKTGYVFIGHHEVGATEESYLDIGFFTIFRNDRPE